MLLRQEITAKLSADITLIFDDETKKTQLIQAGNILELTYIKDKSKYTKTGIVKQVSILSYLPLDNSSDFIDKNRLLVKLDDCDHVNNCFPSNKDNTIVLEMDFSKDFESDFEDVLFTNILDIKLLQVEEKMELQNLYDEATSINNDENQWEDKSFNYLQSIMRIVKHELDDPELLVEDVTPLLSILNNAIISLIPFEDSPEPTPIDPDTDNNEKELENGSEISSDDNTEIDKDSDSDIDNNDNINGDDVDGTDD